MVPAGQRDRLERVCRYALRPPVAQERIHLTAEGQVRLQLRQPWRDGTTDVVFDPVEFLGRLAVLVPRPRINLILYYGVLGPRAAWRAEVVGRQSSVDDDDGGAKDSETEQAREADPAETARRQARGQCWASFMARTFGLDVLACPRCGGRLRLITLIEEPVVIQRILRHLGVPTEFLRRVPSARRHSEWNVSARPVGTARRGPIPVPDNSQQWLAREHAGAVLGGVAGHDLSRLASVGDDNSARDGPRIRAGSASNLRCGRGASGRGGGGSDKASSVNLRRRHDGGTLRSGGL